MNQTNGQDYILLNCSSPSEWDGDLLILPRSGSNAGVPGVPHMPSGDITLLEQINQGKGKTGSQAYLSLGPSEQPSLVELRKAGERLAKWLIQHKIQAAGLPGEPWHKISGAAGIAAFCEGLSLGAFRLTDYKSTEKPVQPSLQWLLEPAESELESVIQDTILLARGVNLARAWAHQPPNQLQPANLAKRVERMAEAAGLACEVLEPEALQALGAELLLAVGQGSSDGSRLIILEHRPSGPGADLPPVVLVGKTITFDTGGYSIKTKAGMVSMKFDKAGGMAVLGIMRTVAALDLPIPVVGLIAAAENMVSQQAYRPNDILRSLIGKTVEIVSTDAEGRLVMADALTFACQRYQPRAVIDIATLTSGVVIALGRVRAGLMSNNDRLAESLVSAGERTHERLWRLPLDEEYLELIRGQDSDLVNSTGTTPASAILAAKFLEQFVEGDTPWAHIDIAGTAKSGTGSASYRKGATGFGVRLILSFLRENLPADFR